MAVSSTTWKKGKPKTGGRKKGTPNKVTLWHRQMLERMKVDGRDPMSFAMSILQNEEAPFAERKWACEQLFPYSHPKLSSVEARIGGLTHEDRLERLRGMADRVGLEDETD